MKVTIDTGKMQVKQIKYEDNKKSVYNFCSDKYSIVYAIDGEWKCTVEGTTIDFPPSTVVILNPATYCLVESESSVLNACVIDFNVEDLAGDAPEKLISLLHTGDTALCRSKHTSDNFRMLIDQIDLVVNMPVEQKKSYLELLVSQMIILLNASAEGSPMKHSEDLGAKVIEYLNDNATRGSVSLDELSKRFFVSKYYLCRAFKRCNGISIHGYINRKRITYAKQMIDRGETATSAAYKVGYGDYSAFYRAYMKIVGKSPTE